MDKKTDVILDDVKKLIGPSAIYDEFNTDLVIHINSTFAILNQLGLGPEEGFYITEDGEETWSEFFEDRCNSAQQLMVKSYMYLNARLQFDPPNGTVLEAFKEQIKEYEWRLKQSVELDWETEE